ncbi:AAA family ATPase [candidate division TA06 bacterium DG_78]|uniref:AAA family ATPase n=1 Tax=candidate division TA06 bacterium DG_78 TaxID=1703772 RepID=A0A0S7YIN9_UNCT6|nr:MAG: AAA family ATPase [candidate division TA06 bacterium DG_78]
MGYESFYKLKEHPFSFATDEKFYYNSPQHSKALVKLFHSVETEKGLALLIGDIGTGKTTLSRRLLDQLIDKEIEATLLVIIHSEITSLWFLKKIALMLETSVDSENKLEIITAVYHRLIEFNNKGRKVVILIDEANMLQKKEIMEEIRGLLNLESDSGKLLNFILFGLPEMEDYLKLDPPLYQRIAVRCVLDPLDEEATYSYIKHRLNVAGCEKLLFNNDAMKRIYQYSKGIPRTINAICDNALLEGFLLKKETIDEKIIEDVCHDLGLVLQGS